MVKDNCLQWFRDEFIPQCSDMTIAALLFLWEKYGNELLSSEDALRFIAERRDVYMNTPVTRKES